jgi:hypothetical protein
MTNFTRSSIYSTNDINPSFQLANTVYGRRRDNVPGIGKGENYNTRTMAEDGIALCYFRNLK